MPLIDLPLNELYEYQGRNPRPADFDAYWRAAIEEMRATDPQVELVKSPFQVPGAECFDMYFTGVRGARIHCMYARPITGDSKPHPAVLQFHGYTGNAGEWCDKLVYTSLGFSLFALDCRGQGGKSEDTGGIKGTTHHGHMIRGLDDEPHNMLFRHIYLDTAQLAAIAMSMPEVDEKRVGAMGGSQGGALTLVCGALEPRLKRLAPVFPGLSDYRRVWEMDLAKDAYQEIRTYFRNHDPLHQREEEIFTRLGYIDVQHFADRIQGEVLMAIGMMDTIVPPSTQFAIYNKIKSPKQLVLYPDYGHENLPGFGDQTVKFLLGI